jgi:hypothetical protein
MPIGLVAEVSMFEEVAQNGTADEKHETKRRNSQEGDK